MTSGSKRFSDFTKSWEEPQGRDRIRLLSESELTTYLYYLETEATANEPVVYLA